MKKLFITDKIDSLLNSLLSRKPKSLKIKKEGLAHSILLLALTDPHLIECAQKMNKYLGNEGVTKLEKRGL